MSESDDVSIESVLRQVVRESVSQAEEFLGKLRYGGSVADRHKHLTDASACMAMAMTNLDRLNTVARHDTGFINDTPTMSDRWTQSGF